MACSARVLGGAMPGVVDEGEDLLGMELEAATQVSDSRAFISLIGGFGPRGRSGLDMRTAYCKVAAPMNSWIRRICGKLLSGRKGPAYYSVWNSFRDLSEARRFIYNEPDEAAFDAGGRLDAELVRSHLGSARDVLDIGCGIARVEKFLAPHCESLTGVDISERMLREGRLRLGSHANVKLVKNNGRDLDLFPYATFDFVFSFFVLQHVEKEDAFRYVQEIRRVLRPGGKALLQFPLLASRYFEESFLTDLEGGSPYSVARPRLYTASESVFLLSKAGFNPEELILRGDESIFVAGTTAAGRSTWQRIREMCDPSTCRRLYGHFLPGPPDARDVMFGMQEFTEAARNAAGERPDTRLKVGGDGSVRIRAEDEFLVSLGSEDLVNANVSATFELLGPWEDSGFPDFSLCIRSHDHQSGISGPYVQTDSGNAFSLRIRNGQRWDGLAACEYRSLPPARESTQLTLVADGSCLSLYADGAIMGSATVPEQPGRAFLRIVNSDVRIRDLAVKPL